MAKKHRPTLYRYTFTGDAGVAAGLRHAGKSMMRKLQEKMEFQGHKIRTMTQHFGDSTITVKAHHGLWHMHIDAATSAVFFNCNALGFTFNGVGFGKGLIQPPIYAATTTGPEVDDLIAGRNNWYGSTNSEGNPVLLSWDYSKYKYILENATTGDNFIYYRGCIWIEAPGVIQGAAIIGTNLVVISGGNVWSVPWVDTNAYGTMEDGTWTQTVTWTFVPKNSVFIQHQFTYNASPDGTLWHAHYFGSTVPTTYELRMSTAGDAVTVVSSVAYSDNSTSQLTGSNNYTVPRQSGDEYVTVPGSYSDASSYAYYVVDIVANPAYDGTSATCDTQAPAISVTKKGPFSIPRSVGTCFGAACGNGPPQPANTYRYWYAGFNHNTTKDALDTTPTTPIDPCVASQTITQWVENEQTVSEGTFTGTGTVVTIRDVGQDGAELTLSTIARSGSTEYRTGGDNLMEQYWEAQSHHTSSYIGVASDRASETAANAQSLTVPECPPRSQISEGMSGGFVDVRFYVPPEWPTVRRTGSGNRETTSNNWTEDSATFLLPSFFAGDLIYLLEETYSSRDNSRTVENLWGTHEDTIVYGSTSSVESGWDPPMSCVSCTMGLNLLSGCHSFTGLGDNQTLDQSSTTTINGSRAYRMYMEVDLKEKIALIAETVGAAVSAQSWSWTTSLYWKTPTGPKYVFQNISGKFISRPAAYESLELGNMIYYPASWWRAFKLFYDTDISGFEAQIIPRNDEVLLYAKGAILGHSFDKLFSVQSSAGVTIEAAVTPDSPTDMKAL